MTILPTHTCFNDVMAYMQRAVTAPGWERLSVCHGLAALPKSGDLYAHAWVEEQLPDGGVLAWNSGILDGDMIWYSQAREDFLVHRKVLAGYRRYPLHEVLRENRRTGTFGPWDASLLAYCVAPGETPRREVSDGGSGVSESA